VWLCPWLCQLVKRASHVTHEHAIKWGSVLCVRMQPHMHPPARCETRGAIVRIDRRLRARRLYHGVVEAALHVGNLESIELRLQCKKGGLDVVDCKLRHRAVPHVISEPSGIGCIEVVCDACWVHTRRRVVKPARRAVIEFSDAVGKR
jgi:hypothetical protein